ncbi:MAG: hypothetical protein L7S63_02670 [Flavobacteriales bacterium]|nr:hypothetical protein [Flavobacteriales bacterium]
MLSLFSARPVSCWTLSEVGLICALRLWRSASLKAYWTALCAGCLGGSLSAQLNWAPRGNPEVSASFRAAPPGVWTCAVEARGTGGRWGRSGWQAQVVATSGGHVQGRGQAAVAIDPRTSAGVGLAWDGAGVGQCLLSAGGPDWAVQVWVPLRQPAAQPFQPEWQGGVAFPLEEEARGFALMRWRPGSLPGLTLVGEFQQWACGVGASGAWWSRRMTSSKSGVSWSLSLGLLRGNVPWFGADWGTPMCTGSDPGQGMLQVWLR